MVPGHVTDPRSREACLQIEDAFYFLPSPYPEGKTVGAVRHTSAILNKATSQEVPLSEVSGSPGKPCTSFAAPGISLCIGPGRCMSSAVTGELRRAWGESMATTRELAPCSACMQISCVRQGWSLPRQGEPVRTTHCVPQSVRSVTDGRSCVARWLVYCRPWRTA